MKLISEALEDVEFISEQADGKKSYKTGYKKAIVTLKKGQSIDLTTGI